MRGVSLPIKTSVYKVVYSLSPTQKEKLFAALNIAALCITKNPLITLCMRFFILLLGITKLDWERNQSIMEKPGSTEHHSGNTTKS